MNERLLVTGGGFLGDDVVDPDDVLAFDTQTGTWTVLLEASTGQVAR